MPFCPYCGQQVSDGNQFCTVCGKPLDYTQSPGTPRVPAASFGDDPNFVPVVPPIPPMPPRRTGWVAWLAIAAAVLLVAGAGAAAYLLFFAQTPKELFMGAQARYAMTTLAEVQEGLGPTIQVQQRMQEEPFQSAVTLTADFNVSETAPEIDQIRSLLKQSSLVVNALGDPATARQLTELKLNMRGGELLSAEFYQSPEELALRVPVLHDKYLHLENRDLQTAFRSKGIPWPGPNRILTRQDYEKYLVLDPAKVLPVAREYAAFVTEFINDDEVTLEKNYPYASPDGEVKLKRVTLALSEQRVKDFFIGLGHKFKDDEQALDLVVANTSGFATLMIESGSVSGEEGDQLRRLQDKEYVRKSIQEGVAEWEAEWNRLRLPNGLTIAMVLDGRNNVVQEEILLTVVGDGSVDVDVSVTLTRWDGKEAKDRGLLFTAKGSQGEEAGLEWQGHTTLNSAGERTTRTNVKAWEADGSQREYILQANVISTIIKGVENGKDKRTFEFALESTPADPALSGSVSTVHSSQASGSRFEAVTTLNLQVDPRSAYEPKVTLIFGLDSSVEFGVTPVFPTFSATNSLNLNRMSRSELEELMVDLQQAAERFAMKNAMLFMN